MTRYADGVYDKNAPGLAGYAAVVTGASSNEERLVSQALWAATDPGAASALRNAGAKRNPFPPRLTGIERTQPTIDDIVQVNRRYPDSSAAWSGTSGGMSSSSSPSLGWW